jgi:hypothetical protein
MIATPRISNIRKHTRAHDLSASLSFLHLVSLSQHVAGAGNSLRGTVLASFPYASGFMPRWLYARAILQPAMRTGLYPSCSDICLPLAVITHLQEAHEAYHKGMCVGPNPPASHPWLAFEKHAIGRCSLSLSLSAHPTIWLHNVSRELGPVHSGGAHHRVHDATRRRMRRRSR